MADLFISYARQDRDRVRRLANALSAHGWSVWWDREIQAGRAFDEVIAEALGEARGVIVVWSHDAVTSNWVREEAEEGRRRGILIPLLIDMVRPPLGFGRIQAADLEGWDGDATDDRFVRVIADIARVVGPPQPRDTQAPIPTSVERRSDAADLVVADTHADREAPAKLRDYGGWLRSKAVRWSLASAIVGVLIVLGFSSLGVGGDPDAQPPPIRASSSETALRLYAVLTEGNEKLSDGVSYEVYEAAKDVEGHRRLVKSSSSHAQAPKFSVAPGRYYVTAQYGEATASTEIDVAEKTLVLQTLNLRAGVLRLSSVLVVESPPLTSGVSYDVYEWAKDLDGHRKAVVDSPSYKGPPRFPLPAGKYFVTATYGSATANVDIELAAGEIETKVIELRAGILSLSAILGSGSAPLTRGVAYEVQEATRDAEGKRKPVADSPPYKDPPGFPVPAGRYFVTARCGAASANLEVDVRAGEITPQVLNLHAGVLELSSVTGSNQPLTRGVTYEVYEAARDVTGNRKRVTDSPSWQGPPRLTLPAGRYYITASGDSGKGEAEVVVGEGQLQTRQLRLTGGTRP